MKHNGAFGGFRLGFYLAVIVSCLLFLGQKELYLHQSLHQTVFIASDLDAFQTQEIKDSLLAWELALHGNYTFDLTERYSQADLVIRYLPPNNPTLLSMEKEATGEDGERLIYLGMYVANGLKKEPPTIYLVSDHIYDDETYVAVVLHELGHSFGLEHNSKAGTLMYYSQEKGAKAITEDDIAAYCSLHYCSSWRK